MRVLVVDNYDSFVYNLVQYLAQLGIQPEVRRNDVIGADAAEEFDAVLLSPGPGTPERAGGCVELVGECARLGTPLLGVCLGHQAIGVAFGATVDRAEELMHGKTSLVHHEEKGVLAGLPNPFTATRYHSLTVLPETLPDRFEVTARTEGGVIMGMRDTLAPLEGVQFHPESVMTECGHRMLANWLARAGFEAGSGLVDELEREMRALAASAG